MTIKETIEDVKFIGFLNKRIERCLIRPSLIIGEYYDFPVEFKRTPFDVLKEAGMMNHKSIVKEYIAIREKRSNLPRTQRDCIVYLTVLAMHDVVSFRKKEEKQLTKINEIYECKRGKKSD